MEIRKFTVPFTRIVGEEATELSFGPDDYLVIRPLFSRPASDIKDLAGRITALTEDSPPEEADQLVLDVMEACILEWHLTGPEGPIPMPKTLEQLNALPGAITGGLFPFLSGYRGEGTNPMKAA